MDCVGFAGKTEIEVLEHGAMLGHRAGKRGSKRQWTGTVL
jgi:hypothetical protein